MWYWILAILPKKILSRLVGKLAQTRWPRPLQNWINKFFIRSFRLNMDEALVSDYKLYPTLDALFVRPIRLQKRPLGSGHYVHPADSFLKHFGVIKGCMSLQVKNVCYKVQDLIFEADPNPYEGGFYTLYYLCPTDYHRVHSPVEGNVSRVVYFPGQFWPVNDWSSKNVNRLHAVNERVAVEIISPFGPLWLIMVAALNVGDIELYFDLEFREWSKKQSAPAVRHYSRTHLKKGAELGAFHLGSTVICLLSKSISHYVPQLNLLEVGPVKVRQDLPTQHKNELSEKSNF